MAATAPNESQKPGARTAHGSIRQTSAAASASEVAAPMRELKSHATPTVASMTTVRCAGTPQPASSAYRNAAIKPAITAAVCAAARASSTGERRHSAPTHESDQTCDHRDVQSGDTDQMADAGTVEQRPVGVADGALVAEHQRQQHATVSLAFELRLQLRAQVRACTLDRVPRRPDHRLHALRRRIIATRAHITGRTQISLEHPRFEIETAGIHRAVRALQSHRKCPPLAWLHGAVAANDRCCTNREERATAHAHSAQRHARRQTRTALRARA